MKKLSWRLLVLTLTMTMFGLVYAFAQAITVTVSPGVGGDPNPIIRSEEPTLTKLDDTQKKTAIGMADAVFVATIAEVKLPANPKIPTDALSKVIVSNAADNIAQVTMRIDKVESGKLKAGGAVTVPLQLKMSYIRDGGKWVFKGWFPDLTVNTQNIFLLQRTKNGYSLPMGTNSVRPVDELAQWETALANMPILVSAPASQTAITFGGATLAKVTVRNTTDQPVPINMITFNGYYLGKKMDANIQVSVTDPPEGAQADAMPSFQAPVQLAPKTDQTFTFYLTASPPQAWALFDEESFMMTPIAIRTQVMVKLTGADGKQVNANFYSPLTTMYVGFPLTRAE